MEIVKVNSLTKLLFGSRIIGIGSTAICFLLRNGEVFKLYLNTGNKQQLFQKYDMYEHLELMHDLGNDSYVAPNKVVFKDNDIIGYIMEYRNAKTIKHFSKSVSLKEIIEAFRELVENTYKISEAKFRLADVTDRNILFNKYFSIIDLDQGEIRSDLDAYNVMSYNLSDIATQVVNALFRVNYFDEVHFKNDELEFIYKNMMYSDYHYFYDLMESLEDYIGIINPTIHDLRKQKSKTIEASHQLDYYHRLF